MRRARRGDRRALFALFLSLVVPLWLAASAVRAQAARAAHEDEAEEEEEDEFAVRGQRDFHRNGFYVGVGGAYALQNFDVSDEERNADTSIDASDAWGADIRGGYRFHPNLAVEVEAEYFSQFEFDDAKGLTRARADSLAITGNGKFFFLTQRFQPYVLAGAGMLYTNSERGEFLVPHNRERYEFAGRVGLGLDFYLFDDVVLNAEATYLMPAGSLDDYPMACFVLGAQYRF
jgi:opacity protein-like surface antigen